MPDAQAAARDAIAASAAAAEAAILAERMRGVGAWFAYAALQELAKERATRADAIRSRVARASLAG